jgi:hypothetical protein
MGRLLVTGSTPVTVVLVLLLFECGQVVVLAMVGSARRSASIL